MSNQNHVCSQWCGCYRQRGETGVCDRQLVPSAEMMHAMAPVAKPRMSDLSPDKALKLLYEGNKRFAAGKPQAPNRHLDRLKEVATEQKPFAAILGCADSRVPVEILFDQGFGDLFVTRIAGNISTPECIGSLEFGAHVLGVKVLYVLGHTNCGAVTAAVKDVSVPGQINSLIEHLRGAIRTAKGNVLEAIKENVKTQATRLSQTSPIVAQLIKEEKLIVAGGVYNIGTGRVVPVEL